MLLRKIQPHRWTDECRASFKKLQAAVTTEHELGIPIEDGGKFILTTDASTNGLGASLAQIQGNQEITISFWSKTLNAAQKNYCITHLELLAVVEAVEAHQVYLAGAPFILRTDHSALQWLKSFKNLKGRLARWVEELAAYRYVTEHKRGVEIPHVDAFSRIPNRPCNPNCNSCSKLELKELDSPTESLVMLYWTKIMPNDGITPKEMWQDQREDQDLLPITLALEKIPAERPLFQEIARHSHKTRALWLQFQSLTLINGILCIKFEHTTANPDLVTYQLVLPEKHCKILPWQPKHCAAFRSSENGRPDKEVFLLAKYV